MRLAETIAGRLGILPDEVLWSTGVIGEPMPDSLLRTELPALVGIIDEDRVLGAGPVRSARPTPAPPGASTVPPACRRYRKGQRHDAPDMATMLVFTDLPVEPSSADLPRQRRRANRTPTPTPPRATPRCCSPPVNRSTTTLRRQRSSSAGVPEALDAVLLDLAHQIVKDGEGATVSVDVTGAADDGAAG